MPAVQSVTNYVWTIPVNTQFIAGQGTNCILIQIQTGFTSGVITVKAQNCKGFSALKSLTIRKLPLTPGTISGPAYNLCQKTGVVFSIANVTNAASYLWVVPTGASISSGQGTTSITVDFAANFTTGNVSVNGVNNCGNGPVRNLAVKAKPTTPSVISGTTSVCAHATAVPYSVTSIAGINYALGQ